MHGSNRLYRAVVAGVGLAILTSATVALAGPGAPGPKKDDQKDDKKDVKKDDQKDDFPKFEEVTKDMTVKEGFFTLYIDKKKDKLLAAIPTSMMDTHFLLATSIAGGRGFAGWQWGDGVVYWKRYDKKLVLNLADPRYVKGEGSTVEDVIGRTYPDPIVAAVDIVTETPSGDPVIDLGSLLKSDLAETSRLYRGLSIDSGLSKCSKIKVFPKNLELAVDLAMMSGRPGGGGSWITVHYSLSELPENDYQPRVADDRVGYFMVASKDWTRSHEDKTVFNRYINRWRLEPEDPEAEVSDVRPEDQIVFYIEKTVPKQYRHYVRQGILEWNKAFEKAGLRNAVRVIQQTYDDPQTRDLDPEDVRYNFFRWIVSGVPYAMGPSRVNPFTGQILDADIVFDDALVRFLVNEFRTIGPKGGTLFESPDLKAFLDSHPEWDRRPLIEQLTPEFVEGRPTDQDRRSAHTNPMSFESLDLLRGRGKQSCEYGTGAVRSLAVAGALAAAEGKGTLSKEFIGQVIKEIVAHEVGHTLGLRHNFKASAWMSLAEIRKASDPDAPTCGSVMDYNPSMFAASESEQGDFVTRTIGPYDYWAIEYGYRHAGPGTDEAEMLEGITDRVAEEGLAYATDEDTGFFSPDPLSNRFDAGGDPLEFARGQIDIYNRLLKNCSDWAVEDGEAWYRLRRAFNMLLGEYSFGMQMASRLVGGQYINRDHRGDSDERSPVEIVPVETQRAALTLLSETVFSEDAFEFSSHLLNRLGAGRFMHWESDAMDWFVDYNIHDRVLGIQWFVLFRLLNPVTLNRIHDAELKVPLDQDAMTVPEVMGSVQEMVWSELVSQRGSGPWSRRQPMIGSFRRNLQRTHLEIMINMVLSSPGRGLNADAHAVAVLKLGELGTKVDARLAQSRDKLDDSTRAHLDEVTVRIAKALEAKYVVRR